MIPNIVINAKVDLKKTTGMGARELNRAMKEGLRNTVLFWHKAFFPEHFTRKAYTKYPGAFLKKKKRGEPMVHSGGLRDRLVALGADAVHGTAKSAEMKMRFGRPTGMDEKSVIKMAWAIRKRSGNTITLEDAVKQAWGRAGYGANNVERFQRQMTAVMPTEVREMMRDLKRYVRAEWQKPGPQRVWNIKG
jgi:hypothetical protein